MPVRKTRRWMESILLAADEPLPTLPWAMSTRRSALPQHENADQTAVSSPQKPE